MGSRSRKSIRNIFMGFGSKFILMIFAFYTRTVFIRLLGVEYNGINGLFSNILSILSLTELGIGNVLNYTLYKALREDDEEKIRALVAYFKKIYLLIALAIFVIGIVLIPLLPYIIKSTLPWNRLTGYYVLYLLNTVTSYFVVYKTTVIIADQNNYISSICETVTTVLMYLLQITYLLLKRDFLGYLVIQVVCTIGKNLAMNSIANRKYPYLKRKAPINISVNRKEMFTDIKATFIYKVSAVILNNIDNILISVIVGTVFVGYYSNYYLIVTYITSFVGIFINGIKASIGNLNAEENTEKSYDTFQQLILIFNFISTVIACCFLNCMQQFIQIWIGQENVMPFLWVLVIVVKNYQSELMSPIWMFRETLGFFKQVQYLMPITAVLNFIFSIIFGIFWGVPGILIATVIAKQLSQYRFEPRIFYKEKFKCPVWKFFKNQIRQVAACATALISSYTMCLLFEDSFVHILLRAIVSGVIAVACVWLFNYRTLAWRQIYSDYIKRLLRRNSHCQV